MVDFVTGVVTARVQQQSPTPGPPERKLATL